MRGISQTCERAREWVSLRLDGELSELESALLEAHLNRCAPCAAFAADVEGATLELRSAPLERLEQPVVLPLRRPARTVRVVQLGAAAALVAAAAGPASSGRSRRARASSPSTRARAGCRRLARSRSSSVRRRPSRATSRSPTSRRVRASQGMRSECCYEGSCITRIWLPNGSRKPASMPYGCSVGA